MVKIGNGFLLIYFLSLAGLYGLFGSDLEKKEEEKQILFKKVIEICNKEKYKMTLKIYPWSR